MALRFMMALVKYRMNGVLDDDDGVRAGDDNDGEVSQHCRSCGCDEANDPDNGYEDTGKCYRDCRAWLVKAEAVSGRVMEEVIKEWLTSLPRPFPLGPCQQYQFIRRR